MNACDRPPCLPFTTAAHNSVVLIALGGGATRLPRSVVCTLEREPLIIAKWNQGNT